MFKKLRIRTLSNWSLWITVILSALCIATALFGVRRYALLREAMQDYILCESAAQEFQGGSDQLTKQVRLAASTGEQQYIDAYFQEADVTRSRENALETLSVLHGDAGATASLQKALAASTDLMQTEYYSMRLVEEAIHAVPAQWPEAVRAVELTAPDAALPDEEKLEQARSMLISPAYEDAKAEIAEDVSAALRALTSEIETRQCRAADLFSAIFRTVILCVALFAAMMLLDCLIIRHGVVQPLLEYSKSIRHGIISPIHGVCELQTLAETYNGIYTENAEREMLMKHQAEHDPLTELLNRRSFDQILSLYEKDQNDFALILADVDTFKSVNDTYGHAVGDRILKRAASLLQNAFRAGDYVCRIGGDEFAVIMVDMSRTLYYTITDKITEVNARLAVPEDGLPAVSLSVGVAFSGQGEGGSLFQNADSALYHTKEHGRSGCTLYPIAGT